jgi:hypothetical protein
MRNKLSASVWVLLGGVAALSCSSGGSSNPGTGGSGGSAGGSSGTAGSGAGGTVTGTGGSGGSSSGTAGTGGSAAGTAGATGGSSTGGSTTGSGGGAGSGTAGGGGSGGRGGSGGSGTGGAAGSGTAGSGGRGGGAGSGTGGSAGGGGSSGGRGGSAGGAGGAGGGTGGATNCTGRALSLSANGTSSASDSAQARVEIDLGSDLPIGNSSRTVEYWAYIKTTDWVGDKNEMYYYGGGATNASFGMDFGTNPVMGMSNNHATLDPFTGGINDDSTNDLGINSSTDQWVHIALVWNGTTLITYVNGMPKIMTTGTGANTMLATVQSVLTIGCNPSNMQCFNGLFDEFRVWKVARSASDIQANFNKPVATDSANLVGYWKFDEASGTTTADAVNAAGHTAHAGTLKADTTAHDPTFVTPPTPLPLVCP